jgi:DNA repair exonuclease SbcCD ATPase subunit
MKFKKFRWKNLLSYGNKIQEYVFSDSPELVLIEGENGSGKSSIKEALTVSAYGRSAIRKMKDIPNWINKSTYTYNEIETSGGDTIVIERGIDPNFTKVTVNGIDHNLPDKRKVDEFIEEEILNINFSTFCNTISLSFDDFKSFINLSTSDKRKIIDPIFGIDILTLMRNKVKEDLKEASKGASSLDIAIGKNESLLESSMNQLEELRNKIKEDNDSKIKELESDITDNKKKLDFHKDKFTQLKSKIDSFNLKVTEHINKIATSKSSISELDQKIKIYQSNKCPHCLSDLTSGSSLSIKKEIEDRKKSEEEILQQLVDLHKKMADAIKKIKSDQDTEKSNFYDVQSSLKTLENSLNALKGDKSSSQEGSIQSIIKSIESEIESTKKEKSKYQEEIDLYSTLDDILSDGGIKKMLIERVIPLLNGRISEISNRLDFKFTFSFDSEFNPIVYYLGMEVSPESLSTGQRKKMNLIILLAFIELIKMKHNKMNVMFLDEIFSGLDKTNVYKAIEILREYANIYNMTIFVVSHDNLPEEFFDKKIMVNMPNHFSEMRIESMTTTQAS